MKTVLFIASDSRQSCQTRIDGVQRFFKGTDILVHVIDRNKKHIDIRKVMAFWKPIGVIAECGSNADELTPSNLGRVPTVYLDADRRTCRYARYTVNGDVTASAHLAAQELLALGFEHYATVGHGDFYWSHQRERFFAEAIRLNGRSCSQFDTRSEPSFARAKRLQGWLANLPKPCGIFTTIDHSGEEVLGVCAKLGIKVPEEVAVLSVDNILNICENTRPTLSSIAVDFEMAGYLSAELLQAQLDGTAAPSEHRTFGLVGVVQRQSTQLMRVQRPNVSQAIEFIRLHACEGIGVKDVLPTFGCCRRVAERRFLESTGHTIYDEIRNVRLNQARILLRSPTRNVDSIANICGYKSDSTLRYAFGKLEGRSPRKLHVITDGETTKKQ